MVTDHLSDFVARIRNGYMAKKKLVMIPQVKIVIKVAEVMVKTGYLSGLKTENNQVFAELKYRSKEPVITGIERVSRPGARIYSGIREVPKVLGGLGTNILSTPKGVMDDKQARKMNCGGELIVKIW